MDDDGFFDISFTLHCAVYALVHREEIVYIGQTKKPLTRLYSHANGRGKKLPLRMGYRTRKIGIHFDGIWIRPCMLSELDALEVEMIRKYQPKYNVRDNPAVRASVMIPEDIKALLATIHIEPTPGPLEPRIYIRRRL